MRRRGLSASLERHLERGEEEVRLSRAVHERNSQAFERLTASFDRHERGFERTMQAADAREAREKAREDEHDVREKARDAREDDFKVFVRDLNRKSEKVIEDLFRGLDEFLAREQERTDEIVAEMREAREESKAHRLAILALLDRFPPAQAA